jgi:hypothetical protein
MKRIPLGWLSLLFWIVYAAGAGLGFGIRSCVVSDRDDKIEKIRKDNQAATIHHDSEVAMLAHAAGGKGTSPLLTTYFAKLKVLLDSPEFKGKNVATVLARAKQVKDVPEDLLLSLDPGKSWAGLRDLAAHALTPQVEELNKRYPLTDIMRGTKPVPAPKLKLAPIPGPLQYWDPLFWFWFLLGSSALFVVLMVLIFSLDDSEYHSVRSYPWNRPLGLLYFAAAAPVSVPAITVYGLVRLLSVDMKNGSRWEALRKFAYRWRLVRKLPGPNVDPLVMPTFGEFRLGPAQAFAPAEPEPEAPEADDGPETQWYVIHPRIVIGLTHLLTEKGIALFPIGIRQPKEMTGYAVPAAAIDAFEETLRIDDIEAEDKETDIAQTDRRIYTRKKGKIDMAGFEDKYRQKLDDILSSVSSYAGGVDLFIQAYDARSVAPTSEDGRVRIVYYGTPCPNPERREVRNAFGRAFPADGLHLIAPDPERGIVMSDIDGNPVAQIVGGTVYVLVTGLLGYAINKGDWAAEALARLLHEAVACVTAQMKVVEDDDVLSERWRQALEANREKYVELCSSRFDLARAKLDARVADAENEIVLAGKSITQHLQRRRKAEEERRAFTEKEWPEWQARLRKEFEQLAASACVTGVRCTGDGVEVRTRMVYIPWKGKRYLIGRFLIRLGDDGSVNIVNVANTARDTDYHHPHVRDSGNPCFGQMQEAIGKLMAERQYATVVNLLFRFFESYNLHGGVEEITKWKEVTGEEIQG